MKRLPDGDIKLIKSIIESVKIFNIQSDLKQTVLESINFRKFELF